LFPYTTLFRSSEGPCQPCFLVRRAHHERKKAGNSLNAPASHRSSSRAARVDLVCLWRIGHVAAAVRTQPAIFFFSRAVRFARGNGCRSHCLPSWWAGFPRTGAVGFVHLLFPAARGKRLVFGGPRGRALSRP